MFSLPCRWQSPHPAGCRDGIRFGRCRCRGDDAGTQPGAQRANHEPKNNEPIVGSLVSGIFGSCGYGSIPIHTIFRGMNIHLPAILMFTRGTRFWHTAMLGELVSTWYPINMVIGMYHFWIMLDRMKRETSWNAGLGLMLLISADVFSQLVHKKQCQPLFSRSIRSLKRHLPIKHDIKTISSELPWPMKLLWM